jgi:hypothetical protein
MMPGIVVAQNGSKTGVKLRRALNDNRAGVTEDAIRGSGIWTARLTALVWGVYFRWPICASDQAI